jgi:hypothetical protein
MAQDALEALVRKGRLMARCFPNAQGAATGESYYVTNSAKDLGDAQTIDFELQTLWFSTLSEHRYHRLTIAEIRQLIRTPPHHHIRHVVGDVGDGPFIGRVYASKVGIKDTVGRLKQFMSEARTKHGLGSWVDTGDYGFCVLLDSHTKVEAMADAVMSNRQGAGAIADKARIHVAFAPTSENVSEAIGEL